jgi:DNA repair exonuclease SbcCD ATPase subunit
MAMTMEGITLRRRLLGVDPDEVERLLTERELELGQLSRQARMAEERAAEAEGRWQALEKRVMESEQRALSAEHELKRLQGMLTSLGLELARREQEAEALRVEAEDLRRQLDAALAQKEVGPDGEPGPRPDPTTNFLMTEVAPILKAAEESAGRILQQARVAAEQEKADLNQARAELQAQLGVISSWWKEVHQVLDPIQENLATARKTIEEIGDRVREALFPLTGLIGTVGQELVKLSQISSPPPIPVPPDPRSTQTTRPPDQRGDRLTVSIEGQPSGQTRREGGAVPAGSRSGRAPWWPASQRPEHQGGL